MVVRAQILRLSGNLIRRVEPKHNLRRLKSLKELHLDGNRIQILCDDFVALPVTHTSTWQLKCTCQTTAD